MLDGANVHISIIAFDDGSETDRTLDGSPVSSINEDLTTGVDLSLAKPLSENRDIAFQGIGKVGAFDIQESLALDMQSHPNPHGKPNGDVLKRWINGTDITNRPRNVWIIDFGTDMSEDEAALYETPFEYLKENVRPSRIKNRARWRAENWWMHGRVPQLRCAESYPDFASLSVRPLPPSTASSSGCMALR